MARPYTYSPDYATRVDAYLDLCKDVRDPETNVLRVKIPTIEGFARFIGVHKDTVYEWASKEPAFSDALEILRTEQLERLINSGLAGTYNSTIAKLILSSNHGMKERTDQTTNDKDLPVPILSTPHVQPDNGNKEGSGTT